MVGRVVERSLCCCYGGGVFRARKDISSPDCGQITMSFSQPSTIRPLEMAPWKMDGSSLNLAVKLKVE